MRLSGGGTRRLRWLQFAALLTCLMLPATLYGEASTGMLTGWQYRWGDSPLTPSGKPLWLHDGVDDPEWRPIAFPANPPHRKGQEHVWFRIHLPDGEWHDPVLYITSIDLIAQVYLGEQLIYQHGEFDARGRGSFVGWPWHLIELPADFAGQTLYLRVFSDYTNIGLWGEVRLMARDDAIRHLLRQSAWEIAVSALALALALFAGILALLGVERHRFGAIALFAGASGLMLLAEAPARQWIADSPLAWDTLRAFSYFMMPVAIGMKLASWLEGSPRRWMRWLWRLHLGYVFTAFAVVQSGVLNLALTFPIFDALLAMTLPLMLGLALWQFRRLAHTQRLIVLSFCFFAPLLLADMLVAHGLLVWQPIPLSLGALVFTLACVALPFYHYRCLHRQLALANENLERQVAARTAQLCRLVDELQGLSFRDALTGLYNRRHFDTAFNLACHEVRSSGAALTLLILDLDHFKRINDRFGHDAGDAVLIRLAALLTEFFRDREVACRLGGEEFVVLLPECCADDALASSNALRSALADTPMTHQQRPLGNVTFSAGIASYPDIADPGQLMSCADRALYSAKARGRDCSVVFTP